MDVRATVRRVFGEAVGRPPAWTWFVPGRVEVFGRHTDYAGGRSLVAAVSRGFGLTAAPRSDRWVRAIDAVTASSVDIDPTDAATVFRGWRNYVAVVARRLAMNFPGAAFGADVVFASNLPRAAGVSSSSALVVGLATALVRAGRLTERPEWTTSIETELDLAGYLGAVESGLTFRGLAGTSGVGIHGGSEDHTAILTSRADHVSAFAYVPVRPLGSARLPDDWCFVIMSSGVHAAKAGSVRDRYNRASDASRALVTLGAVGAEPQPATLAELLGSSPDADARLRDRLATDVADPIARAALLRRLDHFVREDARVVPALEAVAAADRETLGQLSRDSQEDADLLLGNQVDETRQLAMLARAEGAFAASSFGAGFGGSVWALVETAEAGELLERWGRAYRSVFPLRIEAEGFVTRPADGLLESGDAND